MAISYNIYANDGMGGLVDYSTPIASTSELMPTTPSAPWRRRATHVRRPRLRYGLRHRGGEHGRPGPDHHRRLRQRRDRPAQRRDRTGSAWPTAGGTCWVSWGYDSTGQGGPALAVQRHPYRRDHAFARPIPSPSIAYLPGVAGYGCYASPDWQGQHVLYGRGPGRRRLRACSWGRSSTGRDHVSRHDAERRRLPGWPRRWPESRQIVADRPSFAPILTSCFIEQGQVKAA